MKLTIIAHDMKTRATQAPGEIITCGGLLTHGANLRIKYIADTCEFRLQVQRYGIQPEQGTSRFNAWRRELQTFARDFGAGNDARVEYQSGETTYAAVIAWSDDVTAQDLEEMEGAESEFGVSPIEQALPIIELSRRLHEFNQEWMDRKE